jgi:plasmid replication initiation protein
MTVLFITYTGIFIFLVFILFLIGAQPRRGAGSKRSVTTNLWLTTTNLWLTTTNLWLLIHKYDLSPLTTNIFYVVFNLHFIKGFLMEKNDNDLVITRHNSLIEGCYKLNLDEQRLLYLCITQLDPRKPLPKDNSFTVTATQFSKVFNVNSKNVYKQLQEASKEIAERWLRTNDGKYREQFRWVFGVRYHDNDAKVTLGFSPWVIPYLTSLKKQFTSLRLSQIANLKSIYSIRLLEFLTQFKSTGKFIIDLDRFKERLGIEIEYKRFYNLKMRVIEPALKELREKSNLIIEWNPVKNGKSIKQLEFIFSEQK